MRAEGHPSAEPLPEINEHHTKYEFMPERRIVRHSQNSCNCNNCRGRQNSQRSAMPSQDQQHESRCCPI